MHSSLQGWFESWLEFWFSASVPHPLGGIPIATDPGDDFARSLASACGPGWLSGTFRLPAGFPRFPYWPPLEKTGPTFSGRTARGTLEVSRFTRSKRATPGTVDRRFSGVSRPRVSGATVSRRTAGRNASIPTVRARFWAEKMVFDIFQTAEW